MNCAMTSDNLAVDLPSAFTNERTEENIQKVLEEVRSETRLCPLCKSVIRLFFINFDEKLLMCENTECDFPFGCEELLLVKASDEAKTVESETDSVNENTEDDDSQLEQRILSGKEHSRNKRKAENVTSTTEQAISSITKLYMQNNLEESRSITNKQYENKTKDNVPKESSEIKINIGAGSSESVPCYNIEIRNRKESVQVVPLNDQIELSLDPSPV